MQLLSIRRIPMVLEMRTVPGELRECQNSPKLEISREINGLKIESSPIRLKTNQGNGGAGIGSNSLSMADGKIAAAEGKADREAATQFSDAGNMLADTQWKNSCADIQYIPDQLTFNWNVSEKAEMEYVPSSLEISVKQWPRLIIEYLGGPLYFPSPNEMGEQNMEMVSPAVNLDQQV